MSLRGIVSLFVFLSCLTTAHAQDVVIVPAGVGRAPDGSAAARVAGAVSARGGTVVPGESVAQRLGLSPFVGAPAPVTSALGQTAETVLELVASGEHAQAIARGEPALDAARAHLAAIGRDAQAAADLANLCLYLVRADLSGNGEDAAATRARGCYAMVPDLPVDERLHPPNVRALVSRVRADIDAASTVLVVRAPPGEQEGCAIRVNGRSIGETPEVREAVIAGSYSLQVDCGGGASGVRTIEVAEGSVARVVVSPRLESALRLTPHGPALAYDSPEVALERAGADAGSLAAATDAQEAIAVVVLGNDVHLRRVIVQPTGAARSIGEATVAASADDAALASAVDGLMGASADTAVATSDGGGRPIVGPIVLGVAGLAALGVLTVGLVGSGCQEEDATGACVEERELSTAPAILYGALGGAAVIGAILWFALGGSGDASEPSDVDVAVGPGSVDLTLAF